MDSYLLDETRKLHVCGNNPDCIGHEIEAGQYVIKGYEGPIIDCDKCHSEMQLKTGRFGKYFGCTGETKPGEPCKNTRKLLRNGEAAPPRDGRIDTDAHVACSLAARPISVACRTPCGSIRVYNRWFAERRRSSAFGLGLWLPYGISPNGASPANLSSRSRHLNRHAASQPSEGRCMFIARILRFLCYTDERRYETLGDVNSDRPLGQPQQ